MRNKKKVLERDDLSLENNPLPQLNIPIPAQQSSNLRFLLSLFLLMLFIFLLINYAKYKFFVKEVPKEDLNGFISVNYNKEPAISNVLILTNLTQVHILCKCEDCDTCLNKFAINQIQ